MLVPNSVRRREQIAFAFAGALLILPACSGGGSGINQIPASQDSGAAAPLSAQQASDSSSQRSALSATPAPLATEMPQTAAAFVNAIGVDTGFGYRGSPYDLAWPSVSTALINSGIKHIREAGNVNIDWYMQRLATLNAQGIHHSDEVLMGANGTPAKIKSDLLAYGVNNVDFVEAQNEYDGYAQQDPDWVAHLVALQQTIWQTVKGDPALSSIAVLGPGLSNVHNAVKLGLLDTWEDGATLHYAMCDLNPGAQVSPWSIQDISAVLRADDATKPINTTETGYGDDMNRLCTLSDGVIAKYDPRTITERFNAGEPRVYFVDFADMPGSIVFGSEGLVHADGSPKLQYTTLQGMAKLLADGSGSFTPTPLSYSLTGNTANVHHTLLQKADGSYYLLLWLEVPSWDHKTRTAFSVPTQRVSLSLGAQFAHPEIYLYGANGKLNRSSLPVAKTIGLNVGDSIMYVHLR